MEEVKPYEEYPARTVALSVGLTLLTYALGAFILSRLALWLIVPYLAYGLWTEYRSIKSSCVHCYYYGRRCSSGRGRLCGALCPRGDPALFARRPTSALQTLAYSLTALAPIIGASVVAIRDATWMPIAWAGMLIVVYFVGNGVIRGRFGCKYCQQQRLGCPWEAKLMKPEKKGAGDA